MKRVRSGEEREKEERERRECSEANTYNTEKTINVAHTKAPWFTKSSKSPPHGMSVSVCVFTRLLFSRNVRGYSARL